jgi:hypothetical protein
MSRPTRIPDRGDVPPANESLTHRRLRKPSVTTAIRQAQKAGCKVAGATVRIDGSVSLTFTQDAGPPSGNPWDQELGDHDVH